MATHESKFDFRDKVWIDEDRSIIALVIGIRFYHQTACEYDLAWWSDGKPIQEHGIDEWRLSKAEVPSR